MNLVNSIEHYRDDLEELLPIDRRASPSVAVGVATYGRLTQLRTCLASLAELQPPRDSSVCIIVADNEQHPACLATIQELTNSFPYEIVYVHEPRRGVATARNAILNKALAQGVRYLAFIDDDETVTPDWLSLMLEALITNQAEIVHGPVIQITNYDDLKTKTELALSKKRPTGTPMKHVSTGNVLFDLQIVAGTSRLRFDEFYNEIGGEDHDFFDRAKQKGYRSIWVKESFVYEIVTKERDNLAYLIKRHFNGGRCNVLKYAHTHKASHTYRYFTLKILGKFFGLIVCLLRLNLRKLIQDAATLAGYTTALIQKTMKTS